MAVNANVDLREATFLCKFAKGYGDFAGSFRIRSEKVSGYSLPAA